MSLHRVFLNFACYKDYLFAKLNLIVKIKLSSKIRQFVCNHSPKVKHLTFKQYSWNSYPQFTRNVYPAGS